MFGMLVVTAPLRFIQFTGGLLFLYNQTGKCRYGKMPVGDRLLLLGQAFAGCLKGGCPLMLSIAQVFFRQVVLSRGVFILIPEFFEQRLRRRYQRLDRVHRRLMRQEVPDRDVVLAGAGLELSDRSLVCLPSTTWVTREDRAGEDGKELVSRINTKLPSGAVITICSRGPSPVSVMALSMTTASV